MDSGEKIIVGLNRFQEQEADKEAAAMDLFQIDPAMEGRQRASLAAVRGKRNQGEVNANLSELAAVIGRNENVMPVVIRAVKAYATVGEITAVMRSAWGEYRSPAYI